MKLEDTTAQSAAFQDARTRQTGADQALAAARQRMAEVRAQPRASYTPISVSVPSFSLGRYR